MVLFVSTQLGCGSSLSICRRFPFFDWTSTTMFETTAALAALAALAFSLFLPDAIDPCFFIVGSLEIRQNFDPGIHQAQNDKITSNCRFCPMASWCCSTWATLLAWPHVSRKQGNSRILMWKDVKVSRTRRNWHSFRWSDSSLFMMFCGFASLCKPPNRSGFVWFCCKNSWPDGSDETISTWAKICFIIHILLYSNILSSRIYVLSISIYYVVV